jgi:DHA1 family bicyclomycin/chloramphenicol resistance-like MFS transporter
MSETRPKGEKASLGLILLLGAMTATPPGSTDIYLPAVPDLIRHFSSTASEAGFALSAFLLGMGVGQLVYGSWSDRVGRRLPLLIGFGLYVVATLGCILSPNIWALVGFRFLQAFGGCAGVVVSRAVVRDRFDHAETLQIFSLLMLVMGIGPILAPLVGAFILNFGDWRLEFWALFGFGLICFTGALLGLKETRRPEDAAFSRGENPFTSYLALLKERRVVGYILAGTVSQAALFAYIVESSPVLIDGYGLTPQGFGWVFATNGAGLITASQINRRLVKRYPPDLILKRTNLLVLGAAGLMLLSATTGFGGLVGVLIPLFVVVASIGVTQPNGVAGALSVDPRRAGSTSALYGAAQFGIGAASSSVAAALHDGTAKPMAMVILVSIGAAALTMRSLLGGKAGEGAP